MFPISDCSSTITLTCKTLCWQSQTVRQQSPRGSSPGRAACPLSSLGSAGRLRQHAGRGERQGGRHCGNDLKLMEISIPYIDPIIKWK